MFGPVGGPEILLILVLALIVFGPRKLPEIGKSLGKMIVEFRRASTDFKRTIEEEVEAETLRGAIEPPRLEPPQATQETAPAAFEGPPATPEAPAEASAAAMTAAATSAPPAAGEAK